MHQCSSHRQRPDGTDETEALLNGRYAHVSVTDARLLLLHEERIGDGRFALGEVVLTGGFDGDPRKVIPWAGSTWAAPLRRARRPARRRSQPRRCR